jgi:hypothetical protein
MLIEDPREHSQSIQSMFLAYSKSMNPEESLTLASEAKRLGHRASKSPMHTFQYELCNIEHDILRQKARHLTLQIRRQHAIYLPCIWEIRVTFQFKIFLFSLLPLKNVENFNFYVFKWQKGKYKYFELKCSTYFPNAGKIYSVLSSYLQHKIRRSLTQQTIHSFCLAFDGRDKWHVRRGKMHTGCGGKTSRKEATPKAQR